jgi:competence protein ComEA
VFACSAADADTAVPTGKVNYSKQEAGMHYLKWFYLSLVLFMAVPVSAGPVDINTADATTLASAINGVGEKKAAMIVEYRKAHGPFASVDDLVGIKGIGAGTIQRNRDNLTVISPAE